MITNYFKDLLLAKLDTDIEQIALATNYDSISNSTNITSVNQKYIANTTNTITSLGLKSSITIDKLTSNIATTFISGSITTNSFDVVSASGFNLGDKILVKNNYYKISNISGNTITILGNFISTPNINDSVQQIITQLHLVNNSNTTLFVDKIDLIKNNNIITLNSLINTSNIIAKIEISNDVNFIPNPNSPTNLAYTLSGNNLTITWDNMNVQVYEYELINVTIGSTSNNLFTIDITDPFYNIDTNSTYIFKARSVNRDKVSQYNNIIITFGQERIIYNSNKSGQWQSYSIKPDGTDEINITNNASYEDHYCTYSPSLGAYIFCRVVAGYLQVHKKDRVSGTVTQLTSSSNNHIFPSSNIDGSKIVCNAAGSVKVIDSSTGTQLYLWTPTYLMDTINYPIFNDNDDILLSCASYPSYRIELRTFSGTLLSTLDTALGSAFPRYNSDFTKIIYKSFISGVDQVYEMNSNGTGKTRITNGIGDKEFVTYSPDELSFAFIQPAYSGNLYISTFASPEIKTNITNNASSNEFNGFWKIIL